MRKALKVFIILFAFMAISVKADYNAIGVVADYTTVYRGDTINLKLGNDYLWDESFMLDNYDEEKEEYIFVKTAEGKYLAESIYIVVDNGLELSIDENKVPNKNYTFADYKKTDLGNKTAYEFVFELDKLNDESEKNHYDGVINNILVDNLKLKVSDDIEDGVYYIETFYSSNFDEDYDNDALLGDKLPISVIDKNNNSNNKMSIKTSSDGYIKNKDYALDLSAGNKYNVALYGDIAESNIICNSKCLVTGIGTDGYIKDDIKEYKYVVTYENGKKEEYVIKNSLDKASIKYNWADKYGKFIVIISNDNADTYSSLADKIAGSINNFNDGYEKFLYSYSKLNDVDKEILLNLNESFTELNEPYIYVIDDGKIVYENHGIPKDEEINKIQEKIDENNRAKNNNTSNMSTCSGDACNISSNDKLDLMTFISENYMVVVIGLSVIVILLILLITIVKKSKNHEETF